MNRRKILLLVVMFFTIQGLHAQSFNCEINGDFANKTAYKYVYLVDFKLKTFIYTAIVNQHFKLVIAQPKNYQTSQLFFEMDSTKSYAYFVEQSKTLTDNRRSIAIENADFLFEENAKDVKVKKGKLNEDILQMYNALNSGDYKNFFDNHPDSPISISLLRALLVVYRNGDKHAYKLFYDKLSDRLKESPEGKELLTKL